MNFLTIADIKRLRRRVGRIFLPAILLFLLPALASGQAVGGIAAKRVASGLAQPLFVTAPPGDYARLFIVQQTGQVRILNLAAGTLNTTPFLDISARLTDTGGEQGLLGMAFDPNYATNGKFYLNFTVPGGAFGNGVTHISQFQVSADPDIADTSNEKILTLSAAPLTFDHPEANHNGGWIGFSPRPNDANNLYIATGDGGNGDDQGPGHIEPGGNAQNVTTLLGKMLRVHVDAATAAYSIPADNPFAGSNAPGVRKEIWAFGLRNPFRDSFDRLTGRLFIGDVGQSTREEVDVQQPSNPGGGENYGWRLREGTIPTPTGNPVVGGSPPPGNVEPILDYPRTTGGTVIGGYVYRGRQIPALQGTYVFGDYLASKIFTLNYDGSSASNFQDITASLFPIPNPPNGNINLGNPSGFGEDANGELYMTDIGNGNVYKMIPVTPNVKIDSITKQAGGPVILKGTGVPFTNVTLQSTPDLTQMFTFLATRPVAGDGTFEYDDSSGLTSRFYRAVYP
jgi:glucose/arabinose dehydrogenase